MNQERKTNKEILDEFEKQAVSSIRKRDIWHGRIWQKTKHLRLYAHFSKILAISFVFFVFYIIYSGLTGHIKYSEFETQRNEKQLKALIEEKAGDTGKIFIDALELLKKYPDYYKKVVNNIQDIEIKPGVCPRACIYYTNFNNPLSFKIPESNYSLKTLIINPKHVGKFNTPQEFASVLVHETDHVEYLESSKLRRVALSVKCSPLLNPHISILSNLPSISHRLRIIEICAEKEQIELHKAAETESGYEIKKSFIYTFARFFLSTLKFVFALIFSIFRGFF